MLRFKRIIITVIFTAGSLMVANIFYPNIGKSLAAYIQKLPFSKQVETVASKANQTISKVLGVKDSKINNQPEQLVSQIKGLSDQVLKQEEVQQITKTVNEFVNQKVEDVKDLSEQQMDSAKKEVRKKVYEQVCNEWLKN
jgi:hypothetical protein